MNEEEDPNREIHESLGKSLLGAVQELERGAGKHVVFPVLHRRGLRLTVMVTRDLAPKCANRECKECYPEMVAAPQGRIYLYEPSQVEKLQRQVDDLIRVLARNAR